MHTDSFFESVIDRQAASVLLYSIVYITAYLCTDVAQDKMSVGIETLLIGRHLLSTTRLSCSNIPAIAVHVYSDVIVSFLLLVCVLPASIHCSVACRGQFQQMNRQAWQMISIWGAQPLGSLYTVKSRLSLSAH